jgi:hypothetical protein
LDLSWGKTSLTILSPGFPVELLALTNFMRLSVMKAAHVAVSSAAYRKSGSLETGLRVLLYAENKKAHPRRMRLPFSVHFPAPFPNGENVDRVTCLLVCFG